jgi:hypothetical protein
MLIEKWTFWLLVFHGLAINNLAAILAQVDLLERPRSWLKAKFPRFGKIGTCVYCLSFWFAGLDVLLGPPTWIIAWLALHRAVQLINEFCERYLNRAPFTIFDLSKAQAEDKKVPPEN